MQTLVGLASMFPIVDELYDTDDQKVEALSPIQPSYRSHRLSSMVAGLTASLKRLAQTARHRRRDHQWSALVLWALLGLATPLSSWYFIPILLELHLAFLRAAPFGPLFYVVV